MIERMIRIGLCVVGILALIMCIVVVVWAGVANPQKARVTATPTPATARDNPPIRAVMDYVPGQEVTILRAIGVVVAMSERAGNDIEIEGWGAIRRSDDWEVQFCYVENGTRACAIFWHDPAKGTVAPKNYEAKLFFDAAKAW